MLIFLSLIMSSPHLKKIVKIKEKYNKSRWKMLSYYFNVFLTEKWKTIEVNKKSNFKLQIYLLILSFLVRKH